MKIGILTYHSVYNFGANLQVFSTIGFLKSNAYDPVVINWVPADLEERYNRTIPDVQIEAHREFFRKNIPVTELCRTSEEVTKVIEKNDLRGVIVGSDAVLQHFHFLSRIHLTKRGLVLWKKPSVDVQFPNPFWGSFIPLLAEKIPVVIMSASSQNANYVLFRGRLRQNMSAFLNRFSLITVRDSWTKRMVKYLTYGKINPDITPDPVFAYNQNIKDQLSKENITEKFNLGKRYLLISFRNKKCVDYAWMQAFDRLANDHGMKCVVLPMPDGVKFAHPFEQVIDIPLSPDEWYALIKYSDGYIGENMHPVVVALHNAVPFYAFDSYGIVKMKYFVNEKSSKVYDILASAGFLDNRINILSRAYSQPSPQDVFRRIVDFDRSKCITFSKQQQEKYNRMMKMIISLIGK